MNTHVTDIEYRLGGQLQKKIGDVEPHGPAPCLGGVVYSYYTEKHIGRLLDDVKIGHGWRALLRF